MERSKPQNQARINIKNAPFHRILSWRFILRAVFLCTLAFLLLRFVDWQALGHSLKQVGIKSFGICFIIEWLFFAIESWRIRMLSLSAFSFGGILRSRLVSLIVGSVLPGFAVSEVVRVFLLDREKPGNKIYIALLLLANRLYGVISLAPIILIAYFLDPDFFTETLKSQGFLLVPLCIALLLAPLLLRFRPWQNFVLCFIEKLNAKWQQFFRQVYEAMIQFSANNQLFLALTSSVVANLLVVAEYWILGVAVGAEMSFSAWCLFIPLVTLATFLPLGIGAVGTQDAALIAVATFLGKPMEPLLAVSVLLHLLRYASLVPGFVFTTDIFTIFRSVKVRQP